MGPLVHAARSGLRMPLAKGEEVQNQPAVPASRTEHEAEWALRWRTLTKRDIRLDETTEPGSICSLVVAPFKQAAADALGLECPALPFGRDPSGRVREGRRQTGRRTQQVTLTGFEANSRAASIAGRSISSAASVGDVEAAARRTLCRPRAAAATTRERSGRMRSCTAVPIWPDGHAPYVAETLARVGAARNLKALVTRCCSVSPRRRCRLRQPRCCSAGRPSADPELRPAGLCRQRPASEPSSACATCASGAGIRPVLACGAGWAASSARTTQITTATRSTIHASRATSASIRSASQKRKRQTARRWRIERFRLALRWERDWNINQRLRTHGDWGPFQYASSTHMSTFVTKSLPAGANRA